MPDQKIAGQKILLKTLLLFILVFSFNIPLVFSQIEENDGGDTLVIDAAETAAAPDTSSKDPQKAALYSALLPGWGQIYNEKYWKLPIVYAGFGTFIYFIDRNSRYYKDLRQKLIDPDYEMKYFEGDFTEDQLTRGKDLYKRWRDLSIIGTGAFYILQIIDATVDAYLFDWDVGEDISLRLEPSATPAINPVLPANSFGISACLSF
ncbi:MAG: DUF5683 domain-containing protein [Bacteroidales bacterium]